MEFDEYGDCRCMQSIPCKFELQTLFIYEVAGLLGNPSVKVKNKRATTGEALQ